MKDVREAARKYFEKKRSGIKQYKRVEEYLLSRLGSNGELINVSAKKYHAYEAYKRTHAIEEQRDNTHNGGWYYIGPDDIIPQNSVSVHGQGRVNSFAFHPTDQDIVYCATAGGGLWKTENKGQTWAPMTDGIPVMGTSGVVIDNTDPDILYLLSGDGVGSNGSPFGYNTFTRSSVGVFKSTDGGNVWGLTGLTFDDSVAVATREIHIDPENNQRLYVCSSKGLYRTEDGGDNWIEILNESVYELDFKPGESNHIYVIDKENVYVSDNHGDTWDTVAIPAVAGQKERMTLTTCSSSPEVVYLLASPVDTLTAMDTVPDHRGFYISIDAGENFALITTRPNILMSNDPMEFSSQAYYDLAMVCHPTQPFRVMVGTIGVWQTSDFGYNWTHDNGINSFYHADIHALQVNPLDSMLYLGCDGGVYTSPDFGGTFSYRSGNMGTSLYYKLATSPFFTDFILAGAQDNGVHLRDDDELVFDRVFYDDGMESIFHPTNEAMAISSAQFGEVNLSLDTGRTFTTILPMTESDSSDWTIPILLDANDDSVIYAGYKPILKSIDQGATWFATSHDTISAHRILINNRSNPDVLFAGACRTCGDADNNFEFYRSEDAGATWERIDGNSGFPASRFITAAVQNPDDENEIWITCGGFEENDKVYRSVNGGDSWSNATGDLPDVPVNAIIFEDNNGSPGGAVYIGTDIGVFYRNDELVNWVYFSNFLPKVEVTDLDIDYNGGFVRAATYGRGLWQSELYTTCPQNISLDHTNQPLGMSMTYHALDQITSMAQVDGAGSEVKYVSGGIIQLNEGFKATSKRGALFRALKGDCDEGWLHVPLEESSTKRK